MVNTDFEHRGLTTYMIFMKIEIEVPKGSRKAMKVLNFCAAKSLTSIVIPFNMVGDRMWTIVFETPIESEIAEFQKLFY